MEGLEKSAFFLLPKSNSMEKNRDKLNFAKNDIVGLMIPELYFFLIMLQRYGELNVMPLSQEIYRASQIAGI